MRVLRDPYSAKPYVLFYTTKRVGGGVQNFEAIKLVKFAASEKAAATFSKGMQIIRAGVFPAAARGRTRLPSPRPSIFRPSSIFSEPQKRSVVYFHATPGRKAVRTFLNCPRRRFP